MTHDLLKMKVPPRFELGSLDSKSRVLTITPWDPYIFRKEEAQEIIVHLLQQYKKNQCYYKQALYYVVPLTL